MVPRHARVSFGLHIRGEVAVAFFPLRGLLRPRIDDVVWMVTLKRSAPKGVEDFRFVKETVVV